MQRVAAVHARPPPPTGTGRPRTSRVLHKQLEEDAKAVKSRTPGFYFGMLDASRPTEEEALQKAREGKGCFICGIPGHGVTKCPAALASHGPARQYIPNWWDLAKTRVAERPAKNTSGYAP